MRKTTKTQTTAYDVTKYLRTPEDMAAYLDAWLTDVPDDPAGIARALGDIARAAYSTRWRTPEGVLSDPNAAYADRFFDRNQQCPHPGSP